MATKAVNADGRLRFKKMHDRTAAIDIDIVHRVKGRLHTEDAAPQTGEMGCHLQDELELCKDLDTSREFKQFYYVLWPLVQSLPEVLHHQKEIVGLLTDRLKSVPVETLPSFLKLVSVLAKDFGPEMGAHFHTLFGVLSRRLSAVATDTDGHLRPELAGEVLECLSYLLKYHLPQLVQDPDCMRQYYGDLLGSPAIFVRNLASKSLSMLLRKLPGKVFTSHMKKIFKAVAINCNAMAAKGIAVGATLEAGAEYGMQLACHPLESTAADELTKVAATRRMHYLINGIRYLIFHTIKGVKGCLHSKGNAKLETVLELMLPLSAASLQSAASLVEKHCTPADAATTSSSSSSSKKGKDGKKASKSRSVVYNAVLCVRDLELGEKQQKVLAEMNSDSVVTAYVVAQVASQCFVALFRHIHPSNGAEMWLQLLELISRAKQCLALYFGVKDLPAAAVTSLRLAVAHCIEMCIFAISHSRQRGLSDKDVKDAVGKKLIVSVLDLVGMLFYNSGNDAQRQKRPSREFGELVERARILLCSLWTAFATHEKMLAEVMPVLSFEIGNLVPSPALLVFTAQLFPVLPDTVMEDHFLKPVLGAVAGMIASPNVSTGTCLALIINIFTKFKDVRQSELAVIHLKEFKDYAYGEEGEETIYDEYNDEDEEEEEDEDSDEDAKKRNSIARNIYNARAAKTKVEEMKSAVQLKSLSSFLSSCSGELTQISAACAQLLQEVATEVPAQRKSKSISTLSVSKKNDCILAIQCLRWMHAVLPTDMHKCLSTDVVSPQVSAIIARFGAAPTKVTIVDHLGAPLASHWVAFAALTATSSASVAKLIAAFTGILSEKPASIMLSWGLLQLLQSYYCLEDTGDNKDIANIVGSDAANQLMHAIGSAIATASYWLRLNLVQLVAYFAQPVRALPSSKREVSNSRMENQEEVPETVELASLMHEIASLPPSLKTEREYARRMEVLEVECARASMPELWLRVVCSFCMSMIHIKFMSYRDPALRVLVAVSAEQRGEGALWPLLLTFIKYQGNRSVEKAHDIVLPAFKEEKAQGLPALPAEDILAQLEACDDGSETISSQLSGSDIFVYTITSLASFLNDKNNKVHFFVERDSRADVESVYKFAWEVLKRVPAITLTRSKTVVPMFLTFLTKQYYVAFSEDSEIPFLHALGLFSNVSSSEDETASAGLPNRVLKARLEMFMEVFAKVTNPKGLFQNQLLLNYFTVLVAHPDITVAKLALDCVLSFKPAYAMSHKDNIRRLLDDRAMREELVTFDVSVKGEQVAEDHRENLIPVLARVTYGRFMGRAGGGGTTKENGIARRAAILAFLSTQESTELLYFISLVLQSLIPSYLLVPSAKEYALEHAANIDNRAHRDAKLENITVKTRDWCGIIDQTVSSIDVRAVATIAWNKQLGFLNIQGQLVKTFGMSMTSYLPSLTNLILCILARAQTIRGEVVGVEEEADPEADDEVEGEGEGEGEELAAETHAKRTAKDASASARIRTVCLARISEMLMQYHRVYDFSLVIDTTCNVLGSLLESLPHSISGARRAPALLKFVHAVISYPETVHMVLNRPDLVKTVIACVASRAEPEVMVVVLDSLSLLLDQNDGEVVLPHVKLVIDSFSKRFMGAKYEANVSELKLSELKISKSSFGHVKTELRILCRFAEDAFSKAEVVIQHHDVANLATLLLGMVRVCTASRKVRVDESWILDILRIYKMLLWRMQDVSQHVNFISRLFGPAPHSYSLFNIMSVRVAIADVYAELAKHPSTRGLMDRSALAMRDLVSIDGTLLGGRCFDKVLPIFQALSVTVAGEQVVSTKTKKANKGQNAVTEDNYLAGMTWSCLLGPQLCQTNLDTSLCTAVVHECIRGLSDTEPVLRTAALACLKTLVTQSIEWSQQRADGVMWLGAVNGIVMPAIRKGIKQSDDTVKKLYLLLLKHCVGSLGVLQSQDDIYHGDLVHLMHEDQEQDFFENITHIQFHRRIKAMLRVNRLLVARLEWEKAQEQAEQSCGDGMEIDRNACPEPGCIGKASLMHVILPMALHHLTSKDFVRKDHLQLMNEAANLVGAAGAHLPWGAYFSTLKGLIKLLERCDEEREKIQIGALCHYLDSFHFDMSGSAAAAAMDTDDATGKEVEQEEEEEEDEEVEEEEPQDPVAGTEQVTPKKIAWTAPEIDIPRTVQLTILPWVGVFLLNEQKDHKGNKMKVIRPMVVVAMTKLIKRLEMPAVSKEQKAALMHGLIVKVVGTLKVRDASARDIARDSLAKMILTVGMGTLHPVLYELQQQLTEGFYRHICNYTTRSVLTAVLENYVAPTEAEASSFVTEIISGKSSEIDRSGAQTPYLDAAIPLIMQAVMDDLTGLSHQDLEVADVNRKSKGREAKGSKANDTLELCARHLLFRPTYAVLKPFKEDEQDGNEIVMSSLHAMISPLLTALTSSVDAALTSRIGEALQRVAQGLARNPTLLAPELLLYLHSTLAPFVASIIRDHERKKVSVGILAGKTGDAKASNPLLDQEASDNDMSDAEDGEDPLTADLPSYLKEVSSDEEERALYSKKSGSKRKNDVTGYRAATWLPMNQRGASTAKQVLAERDRERKGRDTIIDGKDGMVSITGNQRAHLLKQMQRKVHAGKAESASAASGTAAVRFGLSLLHFAIRNNRLNGEDKQVRSMSMPFLPLLGQCLRLPASSIVVATSMRCLCALLTWGLPVQPQFSRALGSRMLKLMFQGGVLLSSDNEIVQACIRGLTSLFLQYTRTPAAGVGAGVNASDARVAADVRAALEDTNRKAAAGASLGPAGYFDDNLKGSFPLTEMHTRSLLQMLTASIMEITAQFQNTAFQLIKAIVETHVVLPEIYELMAKIGEQIVISHARGVRSSATTTFVDYLSSYPMGVKRLTGHIKHMINNCGYQFPTGRAAGLEALCSVVKLLPALQLQDFAQTIFLPMTLQVVNDADSTCRALAAETILCLCRRVDNETLTAMISFVLKWMDSGANSDSSAGGAFPEASRALVRTGAQVAGLLVKARPDLFKKASVLNATVRSVRRHLSSLLGDSSSGKQGKLVTFEEAQGEGEGDSGGGVEEWAVSYHCMCLLEGLYAYLPSLVDAAISAPGASATDAPLMNLVLEGLLYPHVWVRSASCRVLALYFRLRDVNNPSGGGGSKRGAELLASPNVLYQMSRRLCLMLNQPSLPAALAENLHECIVFVVRVLHRNPALDTGSSGNSCKSAVSGSAEAEEAGEETGEAEDSMDTDDDSQPASSKKHASSSREEGRGGSEEKEKEGSSTLRWTMSRLKGLGMDPRGHRRLHVLNIFNTLITKEDTKFVTAHAGQLLELSIRTRLTVSAPNEADLKVLQGIAAALFELLEEKLGSSVFIGLYADMQKHIESSKTAKRRLEAAVAISDPRAFAIGKLEKRARKTQAKKKKATHGDMKKGRKLKNQAFLYGDGDD